MTVFTTYRQLLLATFLGVVFVFGGATDVEASYPSCNSLPFDEPQLPCEYNDVVYDGIIQWTANHVYYNSIFYKQEGCTITNPYNVDKIRIQCPAPNPFMSWDYQYGEYSPTPSGTNYTDTNFSLSYVLNMEETEIPQASNSENYLTMNSPCVGGDSRTLPALKCQIELSTSTITATGTAVTITENMAVEIFLKNSDSRILDSVTYSYSATGTRNWSHTFDYTAGTSTLEVSACLIPSGSSSIFGAGKCVIQRVGNGVVPFDPNNTWATYGGATPTIADVWASNGCDNIGLTDVFPALKCAGIWLFYPSTESVERLKSLTLEHTFPFSYAYDIGNVREELFTSVQTATTTISATVDLGGEDNEVVFLSKAMLENVPYSATIKTLLGYVLWLALAMMIYRRILTVHDTVTPA